MLSHQQYQPEISVVIPVYNSAPTLPLLLERLLPVLNNISTQFEIIFIDDGSKDNSWEVVSSLQRQYPNNVLAIQLMRNYGQHNALMCGFRRSSGKLIVTIDDDLQNPPEEIPKLIKAIKTNNQDLVYGYFKVKKHKKWRNFGSNLTLLIYKKIFNSNITVTSFRVIRRELLESIFTYNLNFTYIDGLLAWNTQRVGNTLVEHHSRDEGNSGYSLGKLVHLALNLFTNFSIFPLQVVSITGFFIAISGFLIGAFYLLQYFQSNITIPGFVSTIIAILILGGVQLISLGIIGEYLGRLHLNVNNKPQYTERVVLAKEMDMPEKPINPQ